MKKFFLIAASGVALTLFCGCSSVQVAEHFNNRRITTTSNKDLAHVSASNSGLYFLIFPIMTGSESILGLPSFFHDNVNSDGVSRMVAAKAKKLGGGGLVDLHTQSSSVGLLFVWRTANGSGNVIR